ncbi:MAG: formylglycine-generating enzyme family protein [Bacillota bacterium]
MRLRLVIALLMLILPNTASAGPTTLPTATETIPGTVVAFKMVKLPAGVVELVQEGRKQTVPIKSIWMAQTELTWDVYDIWSLQLDMPEEKRVEIETRPSRPYGIADRGFGHEGYAAIGIHSNAAQLFCKWLSEKTGKIYRLPTEAEWEYACRAGRNDEPFEDENELAKGAWFRETSGDEQGDPVAHAVASKQPNAWGLYDMLGNVAEWTVGVDGTLVAKGGSFNDKASKVHSRVRWPFNPRWQATHPESPKSQWWLRDGPHIGFRIVREE